MQKVYFKEIDKIIKNYLSSSEFDIKVAVAWITDTKILKALEECLDRGVSVNIIFYKDRINKIDLFENLYKKGAIINYTTSLMHNKFCVIDRRIVINGSYNWTHSAKSNSENIQVTESTIISKQFLDEFNKLLYKSKKADEYFVNHEEKFKEYLDTIDIPKKFPVLYKEEIDNNLKVYYFFNPSDLISGNYSSDNSIRKNSIEDRLKHIYLTFNNLDDFIHHQRSLYNTLYTNKLRRTLEIKKYSHLIIEEKRLELGYIIDLIDESTLKTIDNLSIEQYSDNNIKFYNKKIIYLDKLHNTRYLFFSIDAYIRISHYYKELKDLRITIHSLTNAIYYHKKDGIPFHKLNYFEPNKVFYVSVPTQTNFYLVRGENPFLDSEDLRELKILGPITYDYKYILDLNSFLFAFEYSKNYNQEIEKILIDERRRKREESYKRDLAERLERDEFKKKEKENTQSCYIATMIYNDINHPNVERLRYFRDEVLLLNTFGKIFVKYYYKISPWVVEKFGRYKLLHIVAKSIIEKIILKHIKSKY